MKPLLTAENIKKTFYVGNQTVQALKGITLEVFPGELVAITGPSGSGKTTLINILGGLDTPDSGSVYYKSLKLKELQDAALTELRGREIGFVFQSFALIDILTVYENVELPLRILKQSPGERKERVLECLDFVNLKKRMDHRAFELSGGEQQRAGIARAFVNNPDLIIADEPTGELNEEVAQKILQLFEKIVREYNKTIIIVTHDPMVVEFVDRTFTLVDGELVE